MTMTYLPQELIRKKRDGLVLSDAEITFMVQGITSGQLSDAQLGAFAMAVFQRGMTMPESIGAHATVQMGQKLGSVIKAQ